MTFGVGLGDIIKIIELAISTRKKFVGAPAHFRAIGTDVQNLSGALENVRDFLASSKISDSEKCNLEEALAACRRVLLDVEKAILKYSKINERHGGLRTRSRRIWHKTTYEPDDVRDMRSQIASSLRLLNTLFARYTLDGVRSIFERQEEEHKQRILAWLPLSACATQHADHVRRRLSGTGQWLLREEFYQNFKNERGETVLLLGIPGVGKTVLASTIIDDLRELDKPNERIGICFHYCDYTRQEEQQLDSILLSLVRQLIMVSPDIPKKVQEMCKQHEKTNTWPALNEIEDALCLIFGAFQRTYIVIDAVDEYPTLDNGRSMFLQQLMDLQKRAGANLLFTSRPLLDVKQSLGRSISSEIRASDEDIGSYVESQIGGFPSSVQNNTDLYDRIKQSTIKAADGIFLLATLHLKSVQGQLTAYAVEKMLRKLDVDGSDSSKLYTTTMDRICSQEHQRKELGINTLTWIVYAQRPLRSDELLHALAVDTEASQFHHTNIVDMKELLAACHGLVYVEEETQIVRLIHRTAQEFLEEHGSKWLADPHAMISKTCVAYLRFINPEEKGSQMPPSLGTYLNRFCLYEYASLHWEHHTKRRKDESSALDFAMIQGQVETSSRNLINFTLPAYLELSQRYPGIQGLHLLAYCGLTAFMPQFLEKYDINACDEFGKTPIAYAVERHQSEAAGLLIERGANVNCTYNSGDTLLQFAIETGQEGMVKLLIDAGASIHATDSSGQGLLQVAIEARQERIAKLMIDAGASVNFTGRNGLTPLHDALEANQESIVRLLIDSGASINTTDSDGWTPLHLAVKFSKESIVRLLISSGASINATDSRGRTPLHFAILWGGKNVARLLIDSGASINTTDPRGTSITAIGIT